MILKYHFVCIFKSLLIYSSVINVGTLFHIIMKCMTNLSVTSRLLLIVTSDHDRGKNRVVCLKWEQWSVNSTAFGIISGMYNESICSFVISFVQLVTKPEAPAQDVIVGDITLIQGIVNRHFTMCAMSEPKPTWAHYYIYAVLYWDAHRDRCIKHCCHIRQQRYHPLVLKLIYSAFNWRIVD